MLEKLRDWKREVRIFALWIEDRNKDMVGSDGRDRDVR
jgi:hypothetical protein